STTRAASSAEAWASRCASSEQHPVRRARPRLAARRLDAVALAEEGDVRRDAEASAPRRARRGGRLARRRAALRAPRRRARLSLGALGNGAARGALGDTPRGGAGSRGREEP